MAAITTSTRFQDVSKLLDLLDEIRPYVDRIEGIDMPDIVVVGDQSVGKSSVLESIGGIALPRGSDIVTRCPLILQLRKGDVESAEISYEHDGKAVNKALKDGSHSSAAVQEATDTMCGTDKGVKDYPITVRVQKPDIPNLTLIDLPGITRIAVGDQPKTIEQEIKEMISKYVEGESKVILCVIPANVDFATCEGLKIAQEHDPAGTRTLGVVTKIDKAEKGIADRLMTRGKNALKLRLGFIAVRNRTQEEVDSNLSTEGLAAIEKKFFNSFPQLRQLDEKMLGKAALVNRLVELQEQRVRKQIPELKSPVRTKAREFEKELELLGPAVEDNHQALFLANQMIVKIKVIFDNLARGDYSGLNKTLAVDFMHVAPRVNEFLLNYKNELQVALPQSLFFEIDFKNRLELLQKECMGVTLSNFNMHPVFRSAFLKDVYSKLEEPALDLAENVAEYVGEVLRKLIAEDFKKYPLLLDTVQYVVQDFLGKAADSAKTHVRVMVEQQQHIFTNNGYYGWRVKTIRDRLLSAKSAAEYDKNRPQGSKPSKTVVPPERLSKEIWKAMVDCVDEAQQSLFELQYCLAVFAEVVLGRVCDDVPLGIYEFLVHRVRENLATEILAGLADQEIVELFSDKEAVSKRKQLNADLDAMNVVLAKIKGVSLVGCTS